MTSHALRDEPEADDRIQSLAEVLAVGVLRLHKQRLLVAGPVSCSEPASEPLEFLEKTVLSVLSG